MVVLVLGYALAKTWYGHVPTHRARGAPGYQNLLELWKCKNCSYHRNNFGRFMQPLPKWFCLADLF